MDQTPIDSGSRLVTRTELTDLPPSSKLVLLVLEADGPLTQRELAAETRLPQRTVRLAAHRLVEKGLVDRRPYFPDARQSIYSITATFVD